MLLSNRFSFFNKAGDNVNPQKRAVTYVTVVDDSQFPGIGAIINAYTDYLGQVVYVEILDGGSNYGPNTYLEIRSLDNSAVVYTIPNTDVTIDSEGTITAVTLASSIFNNDFPYPSVDYFTDYSLERVSTGLIAVDQIYVLENVYVPTLNPSIPLKSDYTFPRVEDYGPYNVGSFSANGTSGKITIETFEFDAVVRETALDTLYRVPASVIADLQVGMTVAGTEVPEGTVIYSIDSTRQIVVLTSFLESTGTLSFTAYFPHLLSVGSKISITSGALAGDDYVLTQVDEFNLYFNSSLTVSTTSGVGVTYKVTPQFQAFLEGDDSFFLFTVEWGEEYPTITKSASVDFEFTRAALTDSIPSGTNTLYQRTVYEDLQKTPFTLNIGHSSDVEGVFITILRIADVTFQDAEQLLYYGVYRAETEAEDERLGLLLENMGRDVDEEQELILRDSEVDEALVDYILLNEKRREMLLQGDQIWPYLGSYRGLVNMVNWFGYYDVRLKEYFLNINSQDAEFGKYRQVPITFQLKNKKQSGQSLNLVPSKHYKKTSLFGLFYDIVRDSGEFDEDGIPITQDAFEFTNEEALIKFFALKRYLKEKFLPLNAQIVDITGEGVYYERYGLNSWKDIDDRRVINLTRSISFTCEDRVPIEDLRPYSAQGYLSPTLEKTFQSFLNKYDILDVTIPEPGGPYTTVPLVTFPGSSNQQATGYVLMRGYTGSYTLANPSGLDYQVGDIITLSGGVFKTPVRVTVTGITGGAVTDVDIVSTYQGSEYRSFPATFGQSAVVAATGSQYQVVDRSGFTAAPSDLGFEVEDVIFINKGLGYSTYPVAEFTPNIGNTTAELEVRITGGTPVGNINNTNTTPRWNDSPGIPVGAVASLSTEFPVTWDELPYTWNELSGSTDAAVKVYVDPLPLGTGQVVAAEILNPGTDYTFVPTVQAVSEVGSGATLSASLRNSSLNILEYTVTAVSSGAGTNDIFTVNPNINAAGIRSVSLGRLVKSTGIEDVVLTSLVTTGAGSTITVENYDASAASTTVQVGDKIYVHEGVWVTSGGSGYSSAPGVNVNSGHTRSIFTWNNLGRGEFYQMQWRVILQEPKISTNQFFYDSGIHPIDLLEDHTVVLPYEGKYTAEMVVYNTSNNFANLIKKNCIDVYMLESDFSYIAKFVNDCIDTWDSTYQQPDTLLNERAQSLENNRYIRYDWEDATGRWVNLVFNNTTWEDTDFRWSVADVNDLSVVNNYNFPLCKDFQVLEVSPQDNPEGPVVAYRDSTTTPSAINPTIIVEGQRIYPEIEAPYHSENEWIFIRRDEVIYQLDVLDADYSTPGYTYIELVNEPPAAFRSSPTTWEVLREVEGTLVISGNQIFDADTNPQGIQAGKFLKVFQKNSVPIRSRIPINAKNTYTGQPSSITLDGQGSDSTLQKKGEIGKIYKLRDGEPLNGNLVWDTNTALSSWVIYPANTTDPEERDHVGRIYLRASAVTCNPVDELRPGFSTVKLYAYSGGSLVYTQIFRTTHVFLDSSTSGEGYDIWNEDTFAIDVKGIDGGPIDELTNYLDDLALSGPVDVYLEYEYFSFPTRVYYAENTAGDMEVYFDFNMYPSLGTFNEAPATDFDSTAIADHTNWFFDNGVDSGDFSMEVTQVGSWQGGVGTIITVNDEDMDLLRVSSSFTLCQRSFDEDSAEKKLGTDVITWRNFQDVIWQESCGSSWNTLDYSTAYSCNFIINNVVQNSGLQFNQDDLYSFTTITGGMTTPQVYAAALDELNNIGIGTGGSVNGLSLFSYSPYSETDVSLLTLGINTYQYPNAVIDASGSLVAGDVIYGKPFAAISTVSGVTGSIVTLDQEIQKKATFIGDCVSGGYKITRITGLLENQVLPGDILTSSTLPSYPSTGARVNQVRVENGMVREITLSEAFTGSGTYVSFYAEWSLSNVTPIVISATATSLLIIAQAKTPSVDCLGYLTGDGGLTFQTPDGTTLAVSHTFPVGNYYNWLGFGANKVGSFLNGINEFIINYRNIQTYISEGLSPLGYRGWYPAENLPPEYGYITSSVFSNSDSAEPDSQRLPYERSIGGSLTWEETWCGSSNGKFPLGTSIILTSDTSKIAGKTQYLWRIKEEDKILVETIDPEIMWTFTYPGVFGVELTILDTNGNTAIKERKTFIEVYEAEKS